MSRARSRLPYWAVVMLLGALAGLAWLNLSPRDDSGHGPHQGHAHEDPDIARGRKVLAHPLEEVREIVLARDGARIRIVRAVHAWTFDAGTRNMGAGGADLTTRIAAFSRLRLEKEYPVTHEREREFGLAASAAGGLEATIILEDGAGMVLRFGDAAPDGISRYVRISEPPLLATVPDFHYRNLAELAAAATPD